jgi:cytochrome c-type biogenesis protein CcmH
VHAAVRLFLAALVLVGSFLGPAEARAAERGLEPGAAALESRLLAPCCYGGTLDVHESDPARELRREIEDRLARGESAEAIQADFVERYGEKVLAARSDRPIAAMGLTVAALLGALGIGLLLALRRWTSPRPRSGRASGPPARAERDDLDARIDAELAELEG